MRAGGIEALKAGRRAGISQMARVSMLVGHALAPVVRHGYRIVKPPPEAVEAK